MDYQELVINALDQNNMMGLLCGEYPYNLPISEFNADAFPTDINAVLINCIYKMVNVIDSIDSTFVNTLMEMINSKDAMKLYTAILYFDACVFQEERGKATFFIDRLFLANLIKQAVLEKSEELIGEISFYNGVNKNNPMSNIYNFNIYYEYKYGFSIVTESKE